MVAFIKRLAKRLSPGVGVVLDNAKIHTSVWEPFTEILAQVGCVVLFQPPYSPECNAIEKLWSQLKAHLRGWEPSCVQSLREALQEAIELVTADHLTSYFLDARSRVLKW